jgi:tRNA dimethylallyltransferase
LRAAEVALLTGRRISDLQRESAREPGLRARWLVVDPGRALDAQISVRLHSLLAAGWAEEVRVLESRVPADAPAWQACGYETVRDLVNGALGAAEAREAILIGTRQYAKRQRTWFRHQLTGERVTRLDPHDPRCDALVEDWWSAGDKE